MEIQKEDPTGRGALDTLTMAPPEPREARAEQEGARPAPPKIRTGHDASDDAKLRRDPTNEDAKLDIALDETFPTSDAPSLTQPSRTDPAPSSGYDEDAETARERDRMKAGE